MSRGEEFRYREMARREALWALASLLPGSPRVLDDINVLDGFELRELHNTSNQVVLAMRGFRIQVDLPPQVTGEDCIRVG
jgi:hypothetical protein